jgi:hypothetical protein
VTSSKTKPDEMIRIFEPSDLHIVVTGGETQRAFKDDRRRLSRHSHGVGGQLAVSNLPSLRARRSEGRSNPAKLGRLALDCVVAPRYAQRFSQ